MASSAVLDHPPSAPGAAAGRQRATGSRRVWRASLPAAADIARAGDVAGRPAARRLTVWELLVWAYRDQKVHHYLRRPYDWFLFSLDASRALGDDAPRPKVHPDAALVHGAVMELGEAAAHLVFHHAALADRPERMTTEPVPGPTTPENRRDFDYCRGMFQGRLVDVLVLTAETVAEIEELWERDGRKRMRRVGTRTVKTPVEYCPLDWRPDPHFTRMVNDAADEFERAVAQVAKKLAGVALTAHVVEG